MVLVHLHGTIIFFADGGSQKERVKQMIFGIATRIDMLNFITANAPKEDEEEEEDEE